MRSVHSIILSAILFGIFPSPELAGESPLVEKYEQLDRSTRYRLVDKTPLRFNSYHPQGMVKMKEFFLLSSVHAIDRQKEIGKGYIFKVNNQGEKMGQVEVGEGNQYHPGGIDYDGKRVWVSVAEYKPDSNSIVYTVNPRTLKSKEIFRFKDHLGAVVHDSANHTLVGVSWGSRRWYTWKTNNDGSVVNPENPTVRNNPNHYIDYQDAQWVKGTSYVFMGGLAGYRQSGQNGTSLPIGGIDLWDTVTGQSQMLTPIPIWTDKGKSMNQNPFYLELKGKDLILNFIPEDNRSTLYRYKAVIR
jgi:hypothetical protein